MSVETNASYDLDNFTEDQLNLFTKYLELNGFTRATADCALWQDVQDYEYLVVDDDKDFYFAGYDRDNIQSSVDWVEVNRYVGESIKPSRVDVIEDLKAAAIRAIESGNMAMARDIINVVRDYE